MNSTEAIRILSRSGRKREALEIVERAASAAQAAYRSILDDESRTEDYKRQALSEEYERRREALADKLSGLAESAARSEQNDAQRLFGTAGLPGDPGSLAISRRDASDRVASVESRDELRDLLQRADRAGDEVLARAVAERALDRRDLTTLNAFLASRPHLNAVAQRLWDAESIETGGLEATFALMDVRPPEASTR